MKKMYAPWRHNYVTKPRDKSKPKDKVTQDECVFCHKFREVDDAKHLIIRRFERCAVVMNYYPYNAGHLMVLPLEHKPTLESLDRATRSEIMEAVTWTSKILHELLKCDGMNIGINMGIAGGGGIPSHLHIHALPRWVGDTNFLTTLGQVNVISTDFFKLYDELHKAFAVITL